MVEYNKLNIKLPNTQLKKLKTAATNKTWRHLRMSLKMTDGDNLPHELFLTTTQKIKLRNAFYNMSTDVKLSKARISNSTWKICRLFIK